MLKNIDYSKTRVSAEYKTLYIKMNLKSKVDEIAKATNTSFNHVVIKMIEFCIDQDSINDIIESK